MLAKFEESIDSMGPGIFPNAWLTAGNRCGILVNPTDITAQGNSGRCGDRTDRPQGAPNCDAATN